MRKLLITGLIIIFAIVPVISAGNDVDMAHDEDLNTKDKQHIINRIKLSSELNFCSTVAEKIAGDRPDSYHEAIKKTAAASFYMWIEHTVKSIKNAGRAEEFDDILQVLEKPFKLNIAPCIPLKEYDLVIEINSSKLSSFDTSPLGLYEPGDGILPNKIYLMHMTTTGQLFASTLLHEMGHYFGLADQYKFANASKRYKTKETRPSIMRNENALTCDDADGIITLMDRFYNKPRTFLSICGDGVKFVNGMEIIKETYMLTDKNETTIAAYVINPETLKTGEYMQYMKRINSKAIPAFGLFGHINRILRTKIKEDCTIYMREKINETSNIAIRELIVDYGNRVEYFVIKYDKTTNTAKTQERNTIDMERLEKELKNFPAEIKNFK